jgi:CubicO group peptidase (beta-lactamase class C family)
MRILVVLVLSVVPSLAFAAVAPPQICGAPAELNDGWQAAAPAIEGLDPKPICAIASDLDETPHAKPNGVVVVRHGVLVYEHYFADYNAGDMHALNSASKSVVALLVGIALDRGWLTHINAPVLSFFPVYADLRTPAKDLITLRNLLTMSSGLKWPELSLPYPNSGNVFHRMIFAADPYRFVLAQPPETQPGMIWNYNSGGVELLGDILTKVSRQPLDRFAERALFDPLGFKNWVWGHMPNGRFEASAGLYLRPRDLAKIGQLVLNQGAWHGHQVVSAKWIQEMTSRRFQLFDSWVPDATSYGYLWYCGQSSVAGREINWIAAQGYGGQLLYVVPSEDLVVVVTAQAAPGKFMDLAGSATLDMVLHALEQRLTATAHLKQPIPGASESIRAEQR